MVAPNPLPNRWTGIVAAVHRALSAYPPDIAVLTVSDEDLSIYIEPRNEDAAQVEIGFMAGTDEIYLGIGSTDCAIWDGPTRPVEEELYQILVGVMAGRFEEAGSFFVSGRVQAPHGEIHLGDTSLIPWPWRWRRRRTYAAYDSASTVRE